MEIKLLQEAKTEICRMKRNKYQQTQWNTNCWDERNPGYTKETRKTKCRECKNRQLCPSCLYFHEHGGICLQWFVL